MALSQTQVSQLFVAIFGRASEGDGNKYWQNQGTMQEVAAKMLATEDAVEYFSGAVDTDKDFIEFIYLNVFNKTYEDDAAGIDHWVLELSQGKTRAEVIADMIVAAQDPENAGDAQDLFNNKVALSDYMADNVAKTLDDYKTKTTFKNAKNENGAFDITSDKASVEAAKDAIDEIANEDQVDPTLPSKTEYLSVSQDKFTDGGAVKYTFEADVAQNASGEQVNTLGSGDVLVGGTGKEDTLDATLIAAFNVAGNAMDITPTTTSIENVIINAQISDNNYTGTTTADQVILNARKMEGVTKISSKYSDADLLVKNMTTNGVAGGTAAQTIGMEYTGNKDTNWHESNMTVYYDQDYLVRDLTNESTLHYYYQDIDAARDSGNAAAFNDKSSYRGIEFVNPENGERIELELTEEEYAAFASNLSGKTVLQQYQAFAEILNTKLAELDLGEGWEIKVDSNIYRTNDQKEGQSTFNQLPVNSYAIILQAPTDVILDKSTSANITSKVVDPNKNEFNRVQEAGSSENTPVSINVDLEKVGLAADGGGLIIGSMNKTSANSFDKGYATTETVAGIEVFNVNVNGAADKASSLSYLHSTNNTLRKVEIVSEDRSKEKDTSNADLTIGNSNTDNTGATASAKAAAAFKDVQVMDASAFKGNLTLNAGITTDIIAKYLDSELNLNGDLGFTNEVALFDYKGGSGNDVLNIFINEAALAKAFKDGTDTNSNVFKMDIDGGAGDDTIKVLFDTNAQVDITNITVNGGAGNDTIYLNKEGALNQSANATFTVKFEGNFGTDTIIGFDGGTVSKTTETQNIDLAGFEAHAGETIYVTVGDKTTTFTTSSYMNKTQIDAKVLDMLTKPLTGAATVTQQFDNGSALNNLVAVGKDVNSVTVEVKKGDVVKNIADSETTIQGGLYEGASGADVLDFTAYNAKGIKTIEYTVNTNTYALADEKIAAANSSDKILALVESIHKQGLYDVYETTKGAATADILNGNKVGSIDFSDTSTDISTDLNASQFII